MLRICLNLIFSVIFILLLSCGAQRQELPTDPDLSGNVSLPDGFVVEQAVPEDMVAYPMFATFDNDGRLFVIESSGKTTSTEDVLANPTFRILLLRDENGDGVFDKRSVYADKIPYPMGGTFYRGSFYATAPPDLIRFTDTDGDDVADQREVILTGWTLNHNAATLSGPFFGPDGWMYMCDARRGFDITNKEGNRLAGKGARIWRCRPDGSGLEWVSGGGFDNTIEIAFMPSGETIGTMTYFTDPKDGFRDALMHWVEGGVYPKPHAVIDDDDLTLTGDLMPVMTKLARVSPAGLMRYRGSAFGESYKGNLFSAQFNTGRIMRHIVTADGASYRTKDEPFLQLPDAEMHPTDVLEDADGSLLVVNTGGWFIAGCPLSVVAKTDVRGSIVRIRRKDAPAIEDPRGSTIPFPSLSASQLGELMQDKRPVVRDKAVEQLVLLGKEAVPALEEVLQSRQEEVRTAAVFGLYRLDNPEAIGKLVTVLGDESAMVRTAAARVLGLARSKAAVSQLSKALRDADAAVRRQSATALGQIGDPAAADALLAASAGNSDRFVGHAITHSLITLGRSEVLAAGLDHRDAGVRRTALIALDQMKSPLLTKANVENFLRSEDSESRETGLWVVRHHPGWGDVVINYLKPLLVKKDLRPEEKSAIASVLTTFSRDPEVSAFIGTSLTAKNADAEKKLLLLSVIRNSRAGGIPASWAGALKTLLREKDPQVQSAVLDVVQAGSVPALDAALGQIVRDPAALPTFRMKALGARVLSRKELTEEEFLIVLGFLGRDQEPQLRQAAVRLLEQARLSDDQLMVLAKEHVPDADAYLLPPLVNTFEGSHSQQVGEALVRALPDSADRLDNLSLERLEKIFRGFPASVRSSAEPLMNRMRDHQEGRLSVLTSVEASLKSGDVGEGRKLFFGKAMCSTCHAVAGQGGTFGPDLTNIGEIRSQHDILEAILYPGASLAREYETSGVTTASDVYTGIIKEQLPDAFVIETGPGVAVHLPRADVKNIEPQGVSLMPSGLDKQLTKDELSDLMAYLTTLPDGLGYLKQKAHSH